MRAQVQIKSKELEAFCLRHKIAKLSLFGSALRDDFGPDSDVDVLVEFDAGTRVGLLDIAQMEIELSELLGRKADLRTPAELSRYFRQRVLQEAETLYVHR
jgi:hypothetical protein